MKLHLPINEAVSLIKEKSGKEVMLKAIDAKTINIGYKLSTTVPLLGEISKVVDLDVVVDRVANDTLFLHYTTGSAGGDMLLGLLLSAFPLLNDSDIVDKKDDQGLVVHLDKIEKIEKVVDLFDLKSVSFDSGHIIADFITK